MSILIKDESQSNGAGEKAIHCQQPQPVVDRLCTSLSYFKSSGTQRNCNDRSYKARPTGLYASQRLYLPKWKLWKCGLSSLGLSRTCDSVWRLWLVLHLWQLKYGAFTIILSLVLLRQTSRLSPQSPYQQLWLFHLEKKTKWRQYLWVVQRK